MRTAETLAEVLDEFDRVVGLDRLGSLHVNDSVTPLGSNRDRHVNLGDGEIGARGHGGVPVRAALRGAAGDARGPGPQGQGRSSREDIEWAFELRKQRARRAQAPQGAQR